MMENNCLKRYDEVFFDHERISGLIDELLLRGSILTLKALDAVMCGYLHFRLRQLSWDYPMSIPITIDLSTINLGSSDENYFLQRVNYILGELGLTSNTVQMANNKIYISLY